MSFLEIKCWLIQCILPLRESLLAMESVLSIEQIEKLPLVTCTDAEVLAAFVVLVEEEVEEGEEVFCKECKACFIYDRRTLYVCHPYPSNRILKPRII